MYLELKHILPYIPFQLKAQDIRTKEIRTVTLLHFTYDLSTVGHNHLIYDGLLLSKHLPILRPLSDLLTNCDVEDNPFNSYIKKEFTYIEFLQVIYNEKIRFSDDSFSDLPPFKNSLHFSLCDIFQYSLNFDEIFEIQDKLFRWHFDVFGLIEQGLAISIHDVGQADA